MNNKFDFFRWVFKLDPNDVFMALESRQNIGCYFDSHNIASIVFNIDKSESEDVLKAGGIVLSYDEFIETCAQEGINIEDEIYQGTSQDFEPDDDYYHLSMNY